MVVLETYRIKDVRKGYSIKELVSMQYFTDNEYEKAKQMEHELNDYYSAKKYCYEFYVKKLD